MQECISAFCCAVGDDESLSADNEIVSSCVDAAFRVMRGFAALIDPFPMVFQSQLSDVQYLFPMSESAEKSTLVLDFKVGRLILQNLKQSEHWKLRRDAYMKVAGYEAIQGKAMSETYHTLQNLHANLKLHMAGENVSHQFGDADQAKLLREVSSNIDGWRASFRPGGVVLLDELVVDVIGLMWQGITDVAEYMTSVHVWDTVLGFVKSKRAHDLRKHIGAPVRRQGICTQAQVTDLLIGTQC
jgi:hypothetical protein